MSGINTNTDPSSFDFGIPPLSLPHDENESPNLGQGILTAKTVTPTEIKDTIGPEGQSVQNFNAPTTLNQANLNAATPQFPILPTLDTSGAMTSNVAQAMADSGLIIVTLETINDEVSDKPKAEEGKGSSTSVGEGSMSVANPAVQERGKRDDHGSNGGGDGAGNASLSAAPAEGSAKAPAGSEWFKVSGKTTAQINMLDYTHETIREQTTLLKLTLSMIDIMWDMTLTAAQLQRDIGEKEAEAYRIKAVKAGVQMAVAIATVAVTFATLVPALGGMGKGGTNATTGIQEDAVYSRQAQTLLSSQIFNQLGTIVNSGTEMVENILLADNAIEKANLEARLKEQEGRIQQIKMLLDQMMQSLEQQHSVVDQFLRWVGELSKAGVNSLTAQGQ